MDGLRLRWAIAVMGAVCVLYAAVLHPWIMGWGATAEEQRMALPGDQLTPDPGSRYTRAITISAPVEQVWRWVVQIGQERAGFYSNSWLENLTSADIHNAAEIRSEWQERKLGDRVLLARPDLFGGRFARVAQTRIEALEPGRMIANIPGRFVLAPVDEKTTRLIVREPIPETGAVTTFLMAAVWDPMHFVMVQRMMRGIKERAEGRPLVTPVLHAMAAAGWGFGVAALMIFFGRRRWYWMALPVACVIPVIRETGDWQSAMAGFVAIGFTVWGFVAMGRRWWRIYLLIATAVALVLLLAADAFTAFGLAFLICAAAVGMAEWRRRAVTAT